MFASGAMMILPIIFITLTMIIIVCGGSIRIYGSMVRAAGVLYAIAGERNLRNLLGSVKERARVSKITPDFW